MKRADRCEPEVAGVQRAVRAQQFLGFLPEVHHPLRDGVQRRPGVGQFDAPSTALEQFDPVRCLEFLDLRGDRWLPDPERLGG